MVHPGLTLGLTVAVAIGTVIYYYFKNDGFLHSYDEGPVRIQFPPTPETRRRNIQFPSTSKTRRRNNFNELECIICLDSLKIDSVTQVSCGHKFHERCLKQWFSHQKTCPSCRKSI